MAAKHMAAKHSSVELTRAVVDSGHEIWLAGLGAFSTARKEGSKLFELLVDEGKVRAQSLTGGGVRQLRSQASESMEKLEQAFEERLTRALKGIGVPTAREVEKLTARVAELDKHVAALARGNGASRPARAAKPEKAEKAEKAGKAGKAGKRRPGSAAASEARKARL